VLNQWVREGEKRGVGAGDRRVWVLSFFSRNLRRRA